MLQSPIFFLMYKGWSFPEDTGHILSESDPLLSNSADSETETQVFCCYCFQVLFGEGKMLSF